MANILVNEQLLLVVLATLFNLRRIFKWLQLVAYGCGLEGLVGYYVRLKGRSTPLAFVWMVLLNWALLVQHFSCLL